MQVKSIAVTDYSTGTQYTYCGTSGNWQSIQAVGGKVTANGGSGASPADYSAPAVTASSDSAPIPFEGTHRDSSSTYSQPNVYPWVAGATTLQTSATATATTYPGLPSGWTVSNSGKVIPPSAASVSEPPRSFALPCYHRLESDADVRWTAITPTRFVYIGIASLVTCSWWF